MFDRGEEGRDGPAAAPFTQAPHMNLGHKQRAALQVLHEKGRRAAGCLRFAAALRVIGIACRVARAARRDQTAFGVIAIGEGDRLARTPFAPLFLAAYVDNLCNIKSLP